MHLTVDIRGATLLAQMAGRAAQLHAALVRVMTRLSIVIQRDVKEGKLTGQVLHVRTGTLRRSINRKVFDQGGGVVASVGTNVRYARAHEYGFAGDVDVRAHVRASRDGGEAIRVRAHTRRVNMPERSFLRSSIDDNADMIKREVRAAVMAVVRGGA